MTAPSDPEVAPKPSLTQTFSWLDGDPVWDEYGWMSSDEAFVEDEGEEPRAYLVETWERTGYEVRWSQPPLYACEDDSDGDTCDDPAVAWQRTHTGWMQVCETHRTEGADR